MAILIGDKATEERAGNIEFATDAEAFAGADIPRAITPDQLLAVVGQGVGAVAGGLIYRGVFNATTQEPNLQNAQQGDFYKVNVQGNAFGDTFSVGDMILINADMGGAIDNAKIDKIDNAESLTTLDDLSDVTAPAPNENRYLKYFNGAWQPDLLSIDDISNNASIVLQDDNVSRLTNDSNFIDVSGSAITSVNGVNPVAQVITIDSDNIIGDRAGVNYVSANTDNLTTHLSGVDTKLGSIDTVISNLELSSLQNIALTGTLSAGEVLRYDGNNWVDAQLQSTDLSDSASIVRENDNVSRLTNDSNFIDVSGSAITSVNGVNPVAQVITIDSDNIIGDRAGVNYVSANTDNLTTHLSGVDTKLGSIDTVISNLELSSLQNIALTGTLSAGEVLRYDGNNWVDAQLQSTDLSDSASIVRENDNVSRLTNDSNFIDVSGSAITSVNGVNPVAQVITIDSDNIIGDRAGVNYVSANTDNLTTHLSGVDTKLGSIDTVISNLELSSLQNIALTGTLSAGEVLRYDGNNWVDAQLQSTDLSDSASIVRENDNVSRLTNDSNFIDVSGSAITSVNGVNPVAQVITIDSDNIIGDRAGVNYVSANTDNLTTHLSGVDTKLGSIDTVISNLDLGSLTDTALTGTLSAGEVLRYDGNNWVDAQLSYTDLSSTPSLASTSDDITSDHTGVNYTGILNATLTTHLSGIDTALANAGSSFVVDDVANATNLVKNRYYQAVNNTTVTHTLPATGTSSEGDVIRFSRAQSDHSVVIQQNGADAGTKLYSGIGFTSSYTLTRRGEYAEFVYDATDTTWRVVNEREAYLPKTQVSNANPLSIVRPTFYFLNPANAGVINLTLPLFSTLKDGDVFEFMVEVDRDLELNVHATDSGNVPIMQNATNNGDQLTVSLVKGTIFRLIVGANNYRVLKELGSASLLDVGTTANKVVQLDSNARLPAVDGSALTGLNAGGKTFARKNINFNVDVNHHYSIDSANQSIVATLPALSTLNDGDEVRFYFRNRGGVNDISINVANASGDLIDDSASYILDVEYESITLVANTTDSIWELI